MATAIPFPGWQTSANGTTLASGAKIYFYVPGTVTLRTPFTDSALTVPTTNPVILNSSGWPTTSIYLDSSLAYEYVVKSSDDATTYVPATLIPAGVSGSQPVDATLTALAGLSVENRDIIVATGVDTFEAKTYNLRNEVLLEWSGGGAGDAALDQTAIAAAAAAGQVVRLLRGVTYYMTAGVTPITGFGMIFEPGAKIVAVTRASGSGSAGFKNYSGLAANRNAVAGVMFMLTASGGVFTFVNPTFEGDNSNQPILRPIYAQGSYLYIRGTLTVTNMNAANGCLSLNEMLGGTVEGYDLRANADMVDASYTDLTNYSPAGIVMDDDGTFRSSRMTFGPGIVKAFNRASGGADPFESDGITVGGIGKSLRSGAVGGHVFGPIYAEDLGEGVDCFQDDCVFESIKSKSCALFGVKFVHGAQRNVVQWLDVDTYGIAGITFAGSSATTTETLDNVVLDGIMRNGGKVGSPAESYCVLFQDGGGTGYAESNRVNLREVVIDSDTDYIAKDNHAVSALDNRVRVDTVTGTPAISAAITTVASNLQLRVGGGLTRLTMSGNQTGISSATYTTVNFDTVATDLLSESVVASDKIRIKYPGRHKLHASVRLALNAGDEVELRILQNGTGSVSSTSACISGSVAQSYECSRVIYITENDAGTAAADFRVEVRVTSAGAITITNSALLTFFECVALD